MNCIVETGENYNDEEESEPEELQQITQINQILPDKNDHYEVKKKINDNYKNFTINTGSPVTIMPNNRKLYNQEDNQPLKEIYQDVNKNEIKFFGKKWANIEYNGEITKLSILITQRSDITPLLGVNWLNSCQSPSTKSYWTNPPTNQMPFTQNSTNYLKRTAQSRIHR